MGLCRLKDGLGRLKDGLGRLKDSLGRLKDDLGRLKDGLGRLKDGLGRLKDGLMVVLVSPLTLYRPSATVLFHLKLVFYRNKTRSSRQHQSRAVGQGQQCGGQ